MIKWLWRKLSWLRVTTIYCVSKFCVIPAVTFHDFPPSIMMKPVVFSNNALGCLSINFAISKKLFIFEQIVTTGEKCHDRYTAWICRHFYVFLAIACDLKFGPVMQLHNNYNREQFPFLFLCRRRLYWTNSIHCTLDK